MMTPKLELEKIDIGSYTYSILKYIASLGTFMCSNHWHIMKAYTCDLKSDCSDGSDEYPTNSLCQCKYARNYYTIIIVSIRKLTNQDKI